MRMTEKIELGRGRADAALDAYRGAHAGGNFDTDDTTCISDLLVDLLHLMEADGQEPRTHVAQHVLDTVRMHYEHESNPVNAEEEV